MKYSRKLRVQYARKLNQSRKNMEQMEINEKYGGEGKEPIKNKLKRKKKMNKKINKNNFYFHP